MRYVIRFLQGIDWFNDRAGRLISYLVVPVLGVLIIEVVARYIFNSPTRWGHETAQLIFGAYAVLLGAYALRHKAHVNVELFYHRWSPRTRAIVDLFSWGLFWLFIILLLWKGGQAGWTSLIRLDRTNTSWAPPYYPFKLTIPLGAFLIAMQGLALYIRNIYTAITGREMDERTPLEKSGAVPTKEGIRGA